MFQNYQDVCEVIVIVVISMISLFAVHGKRVIVVMGVAYQSDPAVITWWYPLHSARFVLAILTIF